MISPLTTVIDTPWNVKITIDVDSILVKINEFRYLSSW